MWWMLLAACSLQAGLGGQEILDHPKDSATAAGDTAALGPNTGMATDAIVALLGSATVEVDTSYAGSESRTATDPTTHQVFCQWTWTVSADSSAVRSDCPGCTWAFDLTLSDGHQEAGDCSPLPDLGATGAESYGFSPHFDGSDSGETVHYDNVLLIWQDAPQRWWPLAPATFDQGALSYALTEPSW